ncbi:MAG: HEAT repeat domain-containing protein [Treponema sp.]|nr:HEAT repeat domain-containing protein [Treponema sp.]
MKIIKFLLIPIFGLFVISALFTQENSQAAELNTKRLNTLRYGTETEIAALIQTLKNEKDDSLDDELVKLMESSKNKNVLTGILSFFSNAEKSGLEVMAVRIITERDTEAGETVLEAINYLGILKAVNAAPALKEIIDSEENRFLNTAIRALGRVGGGGSKDGQDDTALYLFDFYNEKNPNNENQREIITALGETRSSNSVPFLSDIIKNNDERAVLRMAALEAMSKIGDKDGLDAIIMAASSSDPNVRSSAIAALGPFPGEAAEKAILDGFRDSYYRTRMGAAQAAGKRKMEAAVPYLVYRAENDDVPAAKDEAIKALGEISSSEAVKALESFFSERKNSDRMRILAAEMLLKNDPASRASKVIVELDEAKLKNQIPLYNGFLRILGPAVSPSMESLARRFFASGTVIEKSYALDMVLNNEFKNLAAEVRLLLDEKKSGASLARKAGTTLDKLGLAHDE